MPLYERIKPLKKGQTMIMTGKRYVVLPEEKPRKGNEEREETETLETAERNTDGMRKTLKELFSVEESSSNNLPTE